MAAQLVVNLVLVYRNNLTLLAIVPAALWAASMAFFALLPARCTTAAA